MAALMVEPPKGSLSVEHLKVLMVEHLKVLMVEHLKVMAALSVEPACASLSVESLTYLGMVVVSYIWACGFTRLLLGEGRMTYLEWRNYVYNECRPRQWVSDCYKEWWASRQREACVADREVERPANSEDIKYRSINHYLASAMFLPCGHYRRLALCCVCLAHDPPRQVPCK